MSTSSSFFFLSVPYHAYIINKIMIYIYMSTDLGIPHFVLLVTTAADCPVTTLYLSTTFNACTHSWVTSCQIFLLHGHAPHSLVSI